MGFLIENAKRAQIILSKHVLVTTLGTDINNVDVVGGVDVSYRKDLGCAAAVAYSIKKDSIVAYATYCDRVSVPYIPGFLAFREAPLIIKALNKLLNKVGIEVLFVNGHGLAHPRKCGIASHIGLVFNMPSIGIAKKLLYGNIVFHNDKEAIAVENNIVGYVLVKNSHKVYVTIGNRITADEATDLAMRTWKKGYALPEPIRLSDEMSRREVKKLAADP